MSQDLIDELVHQFTDPFAAYRELIQNSIDAGSTRIEVTLQFLPGLHGGRLTATVQDWGEGMNRRMIEDYLLTKFRSSKENDLTKIGKYGIGFMSVFALQPDAVTVDTGRDLESWRVLFKPDRTYELMKSPEPCEGTKVTLHRKVSTAEYDQHVARAREALGRWCRHSEVDVTFAAGGADGSPAGAPVSVHEPVCVDAPFQVEHREDGLHVVVGPSRVTPAVTGFYNRGLTLLETTEPMLPGLAVKIVSRELEHTLSRDDVRRDESFAKALAEAKKLAEGPLMEQLPAELEKAAARPDGAADWRMLLEHAVGRLPKAKLWLRAPGGGALAARRASSEVALSATATALSQRLVAAGLTVVECSEREPFLEVLGRALDPVTFAAADRAFTYAEPPTSAQPLVFAAALTELLQGAGCPVQGVTIAEVRGASEDQAHVFVEALGRPQREGAAQRTLRRKKKHPLLCLNRSHQAVQQAGPLMQRAPRLAALLFARQLLVRAGLLDEKTDAYLTGWALS